MTILRGFVGMSEWVVRRVEAIEFLDERTVHRRVSVDLRVPADAVVLERDDEAPARLLPLSVLRRKSLINFDFRGHEGFPMPLLGLRENQALTLAVIRAWAEAVLNARRAGATLPVELKSVLDRAITGDQAEMMKAYKELITRSDMPPAARDRRLIAVLERLASNFLLFAIEYAPVGARRILKFSYDEPLTLLHSTTSYRGHEEGSSSGQIAKGPEPKSEPEPTPTYGRTGRRQSWWEADPLLAGLGFQPTLVRFPVPGAELAASFHVEVSAPPEVSIVEASLLAGRPNPGPAAAPEINGARSGTLGDERGAHDWRRVQLRRRPSFDSITGGFPTVDLHVAEVPYGSLSRAQVALQASPAGWLATASLAAWLASATLAAGFFAKPKEGDLAATVLITFAAAMVAVLVRPDPHRMVTRLLSSLRVLAAGSAVLTLAGALAIAFLGPQAAHWWLLALTVVSLAPTITLTMAWRLARRRLVRERAPGRRAMGRRPPRSDEVPPPTPTSWAAARKRMRDERRDAPRIRLSPWEQSLFPHSLDESKLDAEYRLDLASELDVTPDNPYNVAVRRLGFDRPAIKVDSSEGTRERFWWDDDFRSLLWPLADVESASGRPPT